MNIKPTTPRKRAFTIVEVVISIAIIGIVAAGLMGCFTFSLFAIRMARENQRATQIILERAEAIRCFNWDSLSNVPTAAVTDYYNPATQSPPIYTVTTSLSPFAPSGGGPLPSYAANMQQLTITVSWKTGNISRCRTNITYIAKDGIQNYVY
jgi:prepilin-type N-terminal cleavage/methylation domain-containing protein